MKKTTKQAFAQQVFSPMAETYGVQSVHENFNIEPTHAQTLNDKIVEQSTFLQKINVVPVDEIKGETLFGFVTEPIASRTDTTGAKERTPKNVFGLESAGYELAQVDSDVALPYKIMDVWAKFKDLPQRYSRYVQERIANDREIVGWYGTHAAKDTDRVQFPLLEDVNKGWMEIVRTSRPENIMKEGKNTGEIRIGKGGDYSCLDRAVFDLVGGIPYYMRRDLIALIGEELVSNENALLLEAVQGKPTEKSAFNEFVKKLGLQNWMTPSNFPSRGLVVTTLNNLSLYYQDSSWRRHIKDKPEKNCVQDFLSRNEGYVVEDTRLFVALEFANVKLPTDITADGTVIWG